MWIASLLDKNLMARSDGEIFLDLCFELSPQVQVDAALLLIPLFGLDRYWNLASLDAGCENPTTPHPLAQKLYALHTRWPEQNFFLAPTAPWARWVSRIPHASPKPLTFASNSVIDSQFIQNAPIDFMEFFVQDALQKSSDRKREFSFLCDSLEDLGVHSLSEFLKLLTHSSARISEFEMRFGPLISLIAERAIRHHDNWPGTPYQAPQFLSHSIDLDFESVTSSEKTQDVLQRCSEVFESWEERLRARRSLMKGLDVTFVSDRKKQRALFPIRLTRPTRDAKTMLKLFTEIWGNCQQNPQSHGLNSEDEICLIGFKSLNLENDKEYQLNLFTPNTDETSDNWSELIARMRMHAHKKGVFRIGSWAPQPSFFPERSLHWREWQSDTETFASVPDLGRRPRYLLTQPIPLLSPKITSFECFTETLARQKSFESLERISNPWAITGPEERSYARLGSQWIFWDHATNQAMLHGYF